MRLSLSQHTQHLYNLRMQSWLQYIDILGHQPSNKPVKATDEQK